MEKNNDVDAEWFLKRTGNYSQDVTIFLHQDEIVLGRGHNNGIRYAVGISRQHALLRKTANGHWKIKDLHSMNGVFVNASKITAGCFKSIEEFDIIGLGTANSISDKYFSFILCRRFKPQQNNKDIAEQYIKRHFIEELISPKIKSFDSAQIKERELRKNSPAPQDLESQTKGGGFDEWYDVYNLKITVLKKQKNRIQCRNCQGLDESIKNVNHVHTQEKSRESFIYYKNYDKYENSTSGHKASSKTVNTDDWDQLPKGRRKRKRKKIIDSSDDSDYEIIYFPRKCSKLRKKRRIIILSSDEDELTDEDLPVRNTFPSKMKNDNEEEFLNTFNEINEGKTNSIAYRSDDETVEYDQHFNSETRSSYSSAHCNIQSLRNASDLRVKEDRKPAIKQEYIGREEQSDDVFTINSFANSDDGLYLSERNKCIKGELNVSNGHDDKETLYSQPNDDVIVISDDEDLVPIKKELDEFVSVPNGHIKKEPSDIYFEETCRNKNSIAQQNDEVYGAFIKEELHCDNDKACTREVVDGSFDFGNKTNIGDEDKELSDRLIWPPEMIYDSFDLGNKINIGSEEKELSDRLIWPPEPNDWNKENVSFPQISFDTEIPQFNNEDDWGGEHIKMNLKETTSPQFKSVENKHQSMSIMLTEALPMHYRPNGVRGREEWFVEKMPRSLKMAVNRDIDPNMENTFEVSKVASPIKPLNKIESSNIVKPKSSETKSISLKQKLKKDAGYRLRFPSGESAIRKQDDPSCSIRVVSSGKSNHKVLSPEIIKQQDKKFNLANNNDRTLDKSRTNAHKIQPVQRFKSRNEQLLQDLMAVPNVGKNKKQVRSDRGAILHSGKMSNEWKPLEHFKNENVRAK